ncbi:MAG TPA: DinB family protein [Longimicrobiales bacterium]|nr:DinB family protein [Longimicrobiales bacterium]
MRPYPLDVDALLDDVAGELDGLTVEVRARFGHLDATRMAWRPGPGRWGVGHCLVHVARINELYRARLEPALEAAPGRGRLARRPLRGSWSGRRFTQFVGPAPKRPVRTLALFEPRDEVAEGSAMEAFLGEQSRLRAVLDAARGLDLDRVRISSPATRLLRFPAGDVLRFLTAHERRHVDQALRVLDAPGFPG